MKKKLLIVAHRWMPNYGGLQKYAFMFAEELAKDFDVTIFTSEQKGVKNITPKGTTLNSVKSNQYLYNKFGIPQVIFYPSGIRKLKECVKESDIVLINDRYYISSLFAYRFAKKYKKKVALILHTPILKYRWPLSVMYRVNSSLARPLVKGADVLLGATKKTVEDVIEHEGLKRDFDFVYNPVDPREFKSSKEKFKNFTVLFVGRFVEKKGVNLLPEIARELGKNGIEVIAIGDGPLYPEVVKRSQGIKNIKFTGKITDRDKMVEYYKKSHLFLLPSTHGETFPLVMIDGFASALPCVATKSGTFQEVFDKEVGFLCNPSDIECITKKIVKLKTDQKLYTLMSNRAKEFSNSSLDIRILSGKLKRLLNGE